MNVHTRTPPHTHTHTHTHLHRPYTKLNCFKRKSKVLHAQAGQGKPGRQAGKQTTSCGKAMGNGLLSTKVVRTKQVMHIAIPCKRVAREGMKAVRNPIVIYRRFYNN